uniref:AlNc14C88G5612 protein n=1 Tax=Albugo laibachii Nc14 TaxID=890382 RepID=F0WG82_9STRA|nr:AlNc14C88G5612 [Albugo laibachii Nc14]|eukprot:CCA20217.1 AlNc14C88G5612 [Albugo laibachii Nc14]
MESRTAAFGLSLFKTLSTANNSSEQETRMVRISVRSLPIVAFVLLDSSQQHLVLGMGSVADIYRPAHRRLADDEGVENHPPSTESPHPGASSQSINTYPTWTSKLWYGKKSKDALKYSKSSKSPQPDATKQHHQDHIQENEVVLSQTKNEQQKESSGDAQRNPANKNELKDGSESTDHISKHNEAMHPTSSQSSNTDPGSVGWRKRVSDNVANYFSRSESSHLTAPHHHSHHTPGKNEHDSINCENEHQGEKSGAAHHESGHQHPPTAAGHSTNTATEQRSWTTRLTHTVSHYVGFRKPTTPHEHRNHIQKENEEGKKHVHCKSGHPEEHHPSTVGNESATKSAPSHDGKKEDYGAGHSSKPEAKKKSLVGRIHHSVRKAFGRVKGHLSNMFSRLHGTMKKHTQKVGQWFRSKKTTKTVEPKDGPNSGPTHAASKQSEARTL